MNWHGAVSQISPGWREGGNEMAESEFGRVGNTRGVQSGESRCNEQDAERAPQTIHVDPAARRPHSHSGSLTAPVSSPHSPIYSCIIV